MKRDRGTSQMLPEDEFPILKSTIRSQPPSAHGFIGHVGLTARRSILRGQTARGGSARLKTA